MSKRPTIAEQVLARLVAAKTKTCDVPDLSRAIKASRHGIMAAMQPYIESGAVMRETCYHGRRAFVRLELVDLGKGRATAERRSASSNAGARIVPTAAAIAAAWPFGQGVRFHWDPVDGAVAYELRRRS